jgi:CCR4-NOT transcriptional regulation complex NOT5 subunit
MERYRATEKDSKNKRHSKEGVVIRPEDKRKVETRGWIQKSLDDLRSQMEHIEAELFKNKVLFLIFMSRFFSQFFFFF